MDAIVVNYNTRELLASCVQSLKTLRQAGEIQRIIVVDSESADDSAEHIRERFPDVEVLEVPNRGYGAAANAGIARSRARYYLVLNADTFVPPGSVTRLAAMLDGYEKLGIVGPRLMLPNGDIQPSRRRFPDRLTPLFESTIIQEWWPSNPWTRRYYVEDSPEGRTQLVDWVVGAAMMVRAAAVDQVGGFDETFRMFAEEAEWAHRMRRLGWRTAYVPSATITHIGGVSTSQDVPRRQLDFDASRVEFHRRLYGSLMASLVAAGLRANYLAHIARESAKWLIGHRRELRSDRIRLYARCLKAGYRLNG